MRLPAHRHPETLCVCPVFTAPHMCSACTYLWGHIHTHTHTQSPPDSTTYIHIHTQRRTPTTDTVCAHTVNSTPYVQRTHTHMRTHTHTHTHTQCPDELTRCLHYPLAKDTRSALAYGWTLLS